MRAISLGARRADEALRVVRALGSHRYVAGRLHLVHAFVLLAAPEGVDALGEARTWARDALTRVDDPASRDEALWRRCTDAELSAALEVFWAPGDASASSRRALQSLLDQHGLTPTDHEPFDERAEDEMHPLLVDAGWELRALAELDPGAHKGAMAAFGDALAFESAKFEEETALPPTRHLYELPALGPVELLRAVDDDGVLAAPLVLWGEGDETYLDYIVRGVRRAAKLPERDEEYDEDDSDGEG